VTPRIVGDGHEVAPVGIEPRAGEGLALEAALFLAALAWCRQAGRNRAALVQEAGGVLRFERVVDETGDIGANRVAALTLLGLI